MLHEVKLFCGVEKPVMKHRVQAMERGLLHVDAVNEYKDTTFGVVCARGMKLDWEEKYWLRYWALKPSVKKFWTALSARDDQEYDWGGMTSFEKLSCPGWPIFQHCGKTCHSFTTLSQCTIPL